MKHLFPALFLLVLVGCAAQPSDDIVDASDDISSVSIPVPSKSPAPIEKYPEEFSVEHFKNMALSGTNLKIGAVLEQNSIYTKHTLTYSSNGVLVSGTISIPNGDGPYPLIIQNHGYIDPAIYTNGRGLRREQDAFARAGFAVLHTDYRKHAQSDPDPDTRNIYDNALAYALDSVNAVLAVRELNDPRINASKVGMIGHSMGGGVTQHILVGHPELIDAAILYAPISPVAWQNFERWRLDDREESVETLEAFGMPEENPDAWMALSQTGHLMNIDDPILLFHGTNDKDVPIEWSDALNTHLNAVSKDEIKYVVYQGEGHEFGTYWSDFINRSIEFFRIHLSK